MVLSTIHRDILSSLGFFQHGKDSVVFTPESEEAFTFTGIMALDFVAGCLGGCAGVIVGHPFDTVKVKLQTQDFRNPVYRGTLDCFTKILKTESVSGIYRGVCSPMSGVAVVNAIVFGVYGNIKRNMDDPDSLKSQFLAGAAAGLAQSVVVSPVELVKSRVQTSKQYNGTLDCFVKTYKQEGLRGVFKGLGVTAARELLGCGLYFATYEALTRREPGEAPPGTLELLMAGGLTGTVSWVFTYPLDVIKTRLQVHNKKYHNFYDCAKKSIQEEGVLCLTRGLTPTLIRAFPTNAVTFTVVTWVFRLAEMQNNDTDSIKTTLISLLDSVSFETNVIQHNFIDGKIEPQHQSIKEVVGALTLDETRMNDKNCTETPITDNLRKLNAHEVQTEQFTEMYQIKVGGEGDSNTLPVSENENNIQR